MFIRCFALGICALSMGCSTMASADLPGTLGNVGEGVFRYECVSNGEGDPRCNKSDELDDLLLEEDLRVEPELPRAVAVGARFGLTYLGDTVTDNGEFLVLDTVPARTDVIDDTSGFIIERPGTFSFLARSPKGIVADFVHVTAAQATGLTVWRSERSIGGLNIVEETEARVAVVAHSADDTMLAGALPYRWSSSDESIVTVAAVDGPDNTTTGVIVNDDEVRLLAIRGGKATVTVSQNDLSLEIAINVQQRVPPP